MAKKAMKINSMSTLQRIAAIQQCLKNGDRYSRRFIKLNNALPPKYRVG
jgi:hypothetical protein